MLQRGELFFVMSLTSGSEIILYSFLVVVVLYKFTDFLRVVMPFEILLKSDTVKSQFRRPT